MGVTTQNDGKPKPKLIRRVVASPYYFTTYYFECVNCGAEYNRHRFDSRTSPYCGKCQRKYDTIKAKKRKIEREKYIKLSVLNEIMEYTKGMLTAEKYGLQHKIQSMIDDIEKDKDVDE